MNAAAPVSRRLSISDDSFSRFFWFSALVHFVIFFGFTLKQVLNPSEVIVVQNAMRVDIVALPDKAEPEPSTSAVPEPSKAKPSPPVAVPEKAAPAERKISLEKKKPDLKKPDPKQKQQEALNKLRQQEALERLTAKKSSETPTPNATPKKTLYAGDQVSQGDSVSGLERIAFDDYISQIKNTVGQNFTIPSWLADQKLKCTVEATIDASGRVTNRVLTRASGNSTFDEAALAAVDSSSPFPAVPERLTRAWGSFVIQFSFPAL